MAKIIVNVMPKPVLLDPQGKAVAQAIERHGNNSFSDVRVGKTLELTVAGELNDAVLEEAKKLAQDLFINQELEYVTSVRAEEN